jgi:alpha amylase-like protein
MPTAARYPSLYQINTRVWLERLSREAGRRLTLADIDDATIDGFAEMGFDWIWLLSVWQTGVAGRAVSRADPQWRAEFQALLPDLTEDDILGSGFAITAYAVSDALGGDAALAQFREKLAKRGIKLMLDFVPNHTAPDHPWVKSHPEYYIEGSQEALATDPQNYPRVETDHGPKILAYGRDPNFPGWPDTLQLNYANPELQLVRIDELITIAAKSDGVRCDMAMLLLPEVFERTWGIAPEPFWPKATAMVWSRNPVFIFMAEVYWDLEWSLQQQGFAYCYDRRLYDRLREGHAAPVRSHLLAGLDYQDKLARFLENHDEPRAASEFAWPQHAAATIITFLSPGLRFFHQGQFDGAKLRIPTHLCRGRAEPRNPEIAAFYAKLLQVLERFPIRLHSRRF